MKARLRFLPFYDSPEFGDGNHGYIEKDFDSKQAAFDYMCFYAQEIDIVYIQQWDSAIVESYSCETGFLKELVKKQNRKDIMED